MDDFQSYLDHALEKLDVSKEAPMEDMSPYDIYAEISDMVTKVRREVGLTQKELAKASELTQSNISKIENGTCHPTIDSLKKIADAVGRRLIIRMVEDGQYD